MEKIRGEIEKFLEANENENNIPGPMEYNESNSEREVHNYKCLHLKIRDISNK
jgi:hypothetical protein